MPAALTVMTWRRSGRAVGLGLLAAVGSAACGLQPRATDGVAPPSMTSAQDRARIQQITAARAAAGSDEGYRIGPDDLLEIRIPDLLEIQTADAFVVAGPAQPVPAAPLYQRTVAEGLRVSGTGDLNVPLVGPMHVAGLTPAELEATIARRLVAGGILRQPQVTVLVAEYRSRLIAVVGSVEHPGLYPLSQPGATLSDLLWTAGGPAPDAGRLVEFVPASAAAASDAPIRLDLEEVLRASRRGAAALDPQVRPGDVISVAPAGKVEVDGWVVTPGSYPVTRQLTVSGAVAAAGGVLFAADRHHATLSRIVAPGERRLFHVDLAAVARGEADDIPVADGDVVRVPTTPLGALAWGTWTTLVNIVHVGGNVGVGVLF